MFDAFEAQSKSKGKHPRSTLQLLNQMPGERKQTQTKLNIHTKIKSFSPAS